MEGFERVIDMSKRISFEELKQYDVVKFNDGYDIVLEKNNKYAVLAKYLRNKDLIDMEMVKIVAPIKDYAYFDFVENTVQRIDDKHFIVNGNDIKIIE